MFLCLVPQRQELLAFRRRRRGRGAKTAGPGRSRHAWHAAELRETRLHSDHDQRRNERKRSAEHHGSLSSARC
jgi:hypothetical protein